MKVIYLALFVSALATAGESRVVSCKSAYTGTEAEIETSDNGQNVASSKLVVKIKGLFNLAEIGFANELLLEIPRTACDFEAQDPALIRCSHVFGPGATLKAKTEVGDRNVDLQHAQLETRKLIGVGQQKLGVQIRLIARPVKQHKIETEFFQKDCSAK